MSLSGLGVHHHNFQILVSMERWAAYPNSLFWWKKGGVLQSYEFMRSPGTRIVCQFFEFLSLWKFVLLCLSRATPNYFKRLFRLLLCFSNFHANWHLDFMLLNFLIWTFRNSPSIPVEVVLTSAAQPGWRGRPTSMAGKQLCAGEKSDTKMKIASSMSDVKLFYQKDKTYTI